MRDEGVLQVRSLRRYTYIAELQRAVRAKGQKHYDRYLKEFRSQNARTLKLIRQQVDSFNRRLDEWKVEVSKINPLIRWMKAPPKPTPIFIPEAPVPKYQVGYFIARERAKYSLSDYLIDTVVSFEFPRFMQAEEAPDPADIRALALK